MTDILQGPQVGAATGPVRAYDREVRGEDAGGPGELRLAGQLERLAARYRNEGRGREAESLYGRAYAIKEMVLGAAHPQVLSDCRRLAGIYESMGDFDRAEALFKQVVAGWEKSSLPAEKLMLAGSLSDLAAFCQGRGRQADAAISFRRALALLESNGGSASPQVVDLLERVSSLALALNKSQMGDAGASSGVMTLAEALYELAVYFHGQRELGWAAVLYRRALAKSEGGTFAAGETFQAIKKEAQAAGIDEKAMPAAAQAIDTMSRVCFSQGNYADAEALARRALVLRAQACGAWHPVVAESLVQLGEIAFLSGRRTEAAAQYRLALAIKEQVLGDQSPDLTAVLSNLSRVCLAAGDLFESESLLRRALAILERSGSMAEPVASPVLSNLAEMCLMKGHNDLALRLSRQALAIVERKRKESIRPVWQKESELAARGQKVISMYAPVPAAAAETTHGLDIYEHNILRLVASGHDNREIAERLECLPFELHAKLSGIMRKLAVRSGEAAGQVLKASLAV